MKKVAITGEKQAELIDAEMPRAAGDWVVVKVLCTPMCTEYKSWVGGHKAEFLGHEAAGEVVEVAGRTTLKVGDRVVVTPSNSCGACPLCIAGDFMHCESKFGVQSYTGGREGSATYAQYLVGPAWVMNPVPATANLSFCRLETLGEQGFSGTTHPGRRLLPVVDGDLGSR